MLMVSPKQIWPVRAIPSTAKCARPLPRTHTRRATLHPSHRQHRRSLRAIPMPAQRIGPEAACRSRQCWARSQTEPPRNPRRPPSSRVLRFRLAPVARRQYLQPPPLHDPRPLSINPSIGVRRRQRSSSTMANRRGRFRPGQEMVANRSPNSRTRPDLARAGPASHFRRFWTNRPPHNRPRSRQVVSSHTIRPVAPAWAVQLHDRAVSPKTKKSEAQHSVRGHKRTGYPAILNRRTVLHRGSEASSRTRLETSPSGNGMARTKAIRSRHHLDHFIRDSALTMQTARAHGPRI